MKILHTTDLHGNHSKFKLVLKKAKKHKVDLIINSGDMLPKGYRTIEDMYQAQMLFITGFLNEHFKNLDIPYLCYFGNDDLACLEDDFNNMIKSHELVHNIKQDKIKIKDYEFIGFNLVPDYPFGLKDNCRMDNKEFLIPMQYSYPVYSTKNNTCKYVGISDWKKEISLQPSLEDELKKLVKPEDFRKSIYVIHTPPANVGLDMINKGNGVGSKAVLQFLIKHQPLLSLHGHIHESLRVSGKWEAKIGETTAIQPGQLFGLSYVIIDLKTMTSKHYEDMRLK